MAIAAIIIILLVFFFTLTGVAIRLLQKCAPNEVLIFSGTHRRLADGRKLGYVIIRGGRRVRRPLVERVHRMDLTNMNIAVEVRNAFSKGGIQLNIQGVANVKIPGEEPILNNAIERFLGKTRAEIMQIAKETLEGNLRGVLATLTPEEVNEDKMRFEHALLEEAGHDLNRVGLVLDNLKIQNIWDDRGYLDAIGRVRNADVQKQALIAEALARAESTIKDADNQQATELSKIDAEIRTLQAQTERRVAEARTRKDALVAEQKGEVTALLAKAQAEIPVQSARLEQIRRKLEADFVAPAKAKKEAAEAKAKGRAAKIVEEGRAAATALSALVDSWRAAGPAARDVFLLQKLEPLTRMITSTIHDVKIDRLTVLGSGTAGGAPLQLGDGSGSGAGGAATTRSASGTAGAARLGLGGASGSSTAAQIVGLAEQLSAAVGVDVLGLVQQKLGGGPSARTTVASAAGAAESAPGAVAQRPAGRASAAVAGAGGKAGAPPPPAAVRDRQTPA